MTNIIVCDDIKTDREKVVKTIKNYMDENNFNCSILEFSDYDNKFIEIVKSELENKIYVLDIETPTRSGIDIARIIRKEDVESPIIFLTGHNELGDLVLTKDINFLAFINKFDNSSARLKRNLKLALKLLNKRHMLRFNDRGSIYSIECDKILYITTDTVARKTVIVTDKHEYRVNNPLNYFIDELNDDFCRSHKSCIINKSRVTNLNYNNNTVTFDNGLTIDLLSNKYKKEIDMNG